MPSPQVQLAVTVVPRSIVRATILSDVMASFGIPRNVYEIAQRGYLAGDLSGVKIQGYDHHNYIQDEVTLRFSELVHDDDVSINSNDTRSMVEKISSKLAHAVSFSVNRMRGRGLGIQYYFLHAPNCNTHQTNARYGLTESTLNYEDGYGPRELFRVSPGADRGIHYSHSTASRIR